MTATMQNFVALDLATVGGEMWKAHYDQLLFNAIELLGADQVAAVQNTGLASAPPIVLGAAPVDLLAAVPLPYFQFVQTSWFVFAALECQLSAGVSASARFDIVTANTLPFGAANGSGTYSAANSERYRGQFGTCAKLVHVAPGVSTATFKVQGTRTAGAGTMVVWRGSAFAIRVG